MEALLERAVQGSLFHDVNDQPCKESKPESEPVLLLPPPVAELKLLPEKAQSLESGRGGDNQEEEEVIDRDLIQECLDVYPDKPVKTLFRKCSCGTSWCPVCGRRRLQAMLLEKYRSWDWRRVRSFVLTIDRALYSSPLEAYLRIQRDKELAEFLKRLKRKLRKEGLDILDSFWVMEWHKDGFPHWHFYVLVNKKGRAGRINKKVNLTEAWGRAKHVQEGYIKDLAHWRATVGYAAKHGYFPDGKKEQAALPGWVRDLPYKGPDPFRIKRFERSHKPAGKTRKTGNEKPATMAQVMQLIGEFNGSMYCPESGEWEEPFNGECLTWAEKLDSCGAKCLMTINNAVLLLTVQLKFPYQAVRKMDGEYEEGEGYYVSLSPRKIMALLKLADRLDAFNIKPDFLN
jgi:hypothetical protein